MLNLVLCQLQTISIHAPTRGATILAIVVWVATQFQFTPLREGRHRAILIKAGGSIFQFTPLREGRLLWRKKESLSFAMISIHAPTRGATVVIIDLWQLVHAISIHAPTRGATHRLETKNMVGRISIHAPTRGATRRVRRPTGWSGLFQFTPLREGRLLLFQHSMFCYSYFNSRPYARGDQYLKFCKRKPCFYFNSRPYARGDTLYTGARLSDHLISIHAPTRGATPRS